MAYIRVIGPDEAEGDLKREYDAAIRRAGRVSNIISIAGHNPGTLGSSTRFYLDVMYGQSPLSRQQREMLAVVISEANKCHY